LTPEVDALAGVSIRRARKRAIGGFERDEVGVV